MQAWTTATEYRQLIRTLTQNKRALPVTFGPISGTMMNADGLTISLAIAAVITMLTVPRKIANVRAKGGGDAAMLAQLLRLAAVWALLMAGAVLVLVAAVIQLGLAYH